MKCTMNELEKKMYKFKRRNNNKLFEEIVSDMSIALKAQSKAIFKKYYSNLNSEEDFYNMAVLYLFEAINDYKFICPMCGERFSSELSYKKHLRSEHDCGKVVNGKKVKFAKSKSPIYLYVNKIIKNKLTNVIRDEDADIRKANSFKNRVSAVSNDSEGGEETTPIFYQIESNDNTEELILTRELINEMMDKINSESKQVHMMVFKGLMSGFSKIEIAQVLHKKEVYASLQSAKVMVSKITKDLKSTYFSLVS